MNIKCEECVTDKSLCVECRDYPKYRYIPMRSYFSAYNPVCPVGMPDCILDPAYLKCYHPEWYEKIYGDMTPEEVANKFCNKQQDEYCYDYDNEDK